MEGTLFLAGDGSPGDERLIWVEMLASHDRSEWRDTRAGRRAVGIDDYLALGLVHDVDRLPHYEESQQVQAQARARRNDALTLGVPSRSGPVLADGRSRIVGASRSGYWMVSPAGRQARHDETRFREPYL